MADSPYDVLSVPATASADEVRAAYRALVKRHHPDAPSGSAELFRAVQAAYDVIGNVEKRRKYDAVRELLDDAEQVPVSDPWGGGVSPSSGVFSFSGLHHSSSAAFYVPASGSVGGGAFRPMPSRPVQSGSAWSTHTIKAAYPTPPPQMRYGIQIPHMVIQHANFNLLAQYQAGQRLIFNGQDVGLIVNAQTYDDPQTRSLQITLTVQP